jgi:hypothetical protein
MAIERRLEMARYAVNLKVANPEGKELEVRVPPQGFFQASSMRDAEKKAIAKCGDRYTYIKTVSVEDPDLLADFFSF